MQQTEQSVYSWCADVLTCVATACATNLRLIAWINHVDKPPPSAYAIRNILTENHEYFVTILMLSPIASYQADNFPLSCLPKFEQNYFVFCTNIVIVIEHLIQIIYNKSNTDGG